MTVAFISPFAFSKNCFSGVTFRAKYEVFHKTIYQSQLSKPLEIRLFYRKLEPLRGTYRGPVGFRDPIVQTSMCNFDIFLFLDFTAFLLSICFFFDTSISFHVLHKF